MGNLQIIVPKHLKRRINSAPSGERYSDVRSDIENIRTEVDGLVNGFRESIYREVEAACAIGLRLAQHTKLWRDFTEDNYWAGMERGRPKIADQPDAVRFVLLWIFRDSIHGDKASLYWRAVELRLEARNSAEGIADWIKNNGGVRKLADEAAAQKKEAKRQAEAEERVKKMFHPLIWPCKLELAREAEDLKAEQIGADLKLTVTLENIEAGTAHLLVHSYEKVIV
ncbi:hypothetical protein [Notoacmeibacter ruber]|uniref:Uncharacterized protein n=1 Tax=Notoacmeibacter ruber TaxID=2670375 RepID=A0A3L7J7W7_9HYPH|nr:hypothetical protein [Notoacmeibacter ruber]RLQ86838.1 hypothetical protein D8780_00090 [Notoacmeibacter ruber]